MKRGVRPAGAFSLVEVALALGILTFALLVITALLPIGLKSNQISVEESRAANLLSLLEADLRNSHPAANNGLSRIFHLTLPYKFVSGKMTINNAVQINTLSPVYSTGVNDDDSPITASAVPPANFQASVIYTALPTAASAAPLAARLVISWPASASTDVSKLTSGHGYLEAFVTFPAL